MAQLGKRTVTLWYLLQLNLILLQEKAKDGKRIKGIDKLEKTIEDEEKGNHMVAEESVEKENDENARLVAESEKERNLAEARKLRAEAAKAEYDAMKSQLQYEVIAYQNELENSTDHYHNLYRFDKPVDYGSVNLCMDTLMSWSRMKPGSDMEIVFSSPGGSVIDGLKLFDFILGLRDKGHRITIGMQGMAASMAGILIQAGDHRWAGSQAWYLIHEASFGAMGTLAEVKDRAAWIEEIDKRIIKIFAHRSTLSERKIANSFKRKDWWISPEDALQYGFIDEIRGSLPPKV